MFLLRLPAILAHHPIDDENMYTVVGIELVHGGLPYVNAVERKPPLLLWTYAGALRVVGEHNWAGLHALATLWMLASMLGLYLVARVLWDEPAGLAAAVLYGVFVPWGTFNNLAWNGEMLMNLPVILALLVALRPHAAARTVPAFISGALIGVAALLKQPAAIALAAITGYFALAHSTSATLARRLSAAVASLLGFASVLAAMALALWHLGILREAIYWSVLDHDVPHGPLTRVFWARALPATAGFAAACAPLLWGNYRAFVERERYFAGTRPQALALFGLLGVSLIGAAASGRFYPHYFIQLLPALCLLCAPVASALWKGRASQDGRRRWSLAVGATALACAVFFSIDAVACARTFDDSPASAYVRQHCSNADRIFVWANPGDHVDSHCRPASRYIATFPLTGYIFGSPLGQDPHYDTTNRIKPGSWQTLQRELTMTPPRFIVDADGARPVPRYPIRNYPFLRQLLDREYAFVLRVRDGLIYQRNHQPAFSAAH